MPQMIGAALLLVVLLPFEESLHSLNTLMVNYCTTAVKYILVKTHTFSKIIRSPLAFCTGSALIFK